MFFFFNDTATTEIYTLSLHDALPIFSASSTETVTSAASGRRAPRQRRGRNGLIGVRASRGALIGMRSEEHTSELQSRQYLVCRLLLEKKKKKKCSTRE